MVFERRDESRDSATAAVAAKPATVVQRGAAPSREPSVAAPASLRDTELDGSLRAGPDGHLLVDLSVRRLFDHLLSATGEQSQAEIRERLVHIAQSHLAQPAQSEVIALFDAYGRYRFATATLERELGEGDLEGRLRRLHALREEHLGRDAARAFFAAEEQADAVALARLRQAEQPGLSPEARAEGQQRLESELPPALREARARTVRPLALHQDVAQLRESGGDEAAVRRLRLERVGEVATARLEALDRSRAEFQQRLAGFRAERAEIEAREPNTGSRREAIDRLARERFNEQELLRVEALERLR